MKLDFIEETKTRYLEVKPKRFVIDGRGFEAIEAFIEDIVPVRKLFRDKSLVCYSQDGETGKNGAHCALCRDRYQCRKRLRLMLMVQNVEAKPTPAILEINPQSFEGLRSALEEIEEERLAQTMIKMTVGKNEKGALLVSFQPLF